MTIWMGVLVFVGVVLLASFIDGPHKFKYKKKQRKPREYRNPKTDLYLEKYFFEK